MNIGVLKERKFKKVIHNYLICSQIVSFGFKLNDYLFADTKIGKNIT
jgi:hypothetical protein